jgi:hypothetical protein
METTMKWYFNDPDIPQITPGPLFSCPITSLDPTSGSSNTAAECCLRRLEESPVIFLLKVKILWTHV